MRELFHVLHWTIPEQTACTKCISRNLGHRHGDPNCCCCDHPGQQRAVGYLGYRQTTRAISGFAHSWRPEISKYILCSSQSVKYDAVLSFKGIWKKQHGTRGRIIKTPPHTHFLCGTSCHPSQTSTRLLLGGMCCWKNDAVQGLFKVLTYKLGGSIACQELVKCNCKKKL